MSRFFHVIARRFRNGPRSTLLAPRAVRCHRRSLSSPTAASTSSVRCVDLRSDTVTAPSRPMLECALRAPTGDDVMGEDPTVLQLEEYMADLFGKQKALFVPTGTMGNLVALLSHCQARASEIIIGSYSHLCVWEGGGAANLGGIHTRQIREDERAMFTKQDIRECWRTDNDDHYPKTEVLCLENTHNLMGGMVLPTSYVTAMGDLARNELGIKLHIDGARIFNAAVSLNVPVGDLCRGADSVSICLSKGLGAPLGTVLVGETEFIRRAKRARKRCGGGMRQAGVVAAMGMYAVQHNVERLKDDHYRAQRLATELHQNGFELPRDGSVDTNLVFFGLPEALSSMSNDEFCSRLDTEYGVKLSGGYRRGGGELFRAAFHMDISDDDCDRAIEAIVGLGKSLRE